MTAAPPSLWRAAGPWALLAVGLAAWLARVPLEGIPHVTDEISYTLQARLFADGLRTGPGLAHPSMLAYPFWNVEGASYSPFPPGWPALLAVGEALGLAWLVNPLLAGVLPLVAWLLGREWSTDPRVAALAAAVSAVSPAALVLGASRMAHTSVLAALGVLLVVVVRGRDRTPAWIAAGAAAAYVVLARPFDAAVIAGPLLALGLWRAGRLPARAALVALPGLAAALVLADNHALTGDPLTFPMNAFFEGWVEPPRPGCNRLGFGEDVGCVRTLGTWGHTPAKALEQAWSHARTLDARLLGVPLAGLAALVGLGRLRRPEPWALLALVIGGYALYWSPGQAYGARFWHPLLLVLPVGLAAVLAPVGRVAPALVFAVGLAGVGWLLPDLGDRYWCVDRGLSDLLDEAGIDEGVVLVQGDGVRRTGWPRLGPPEFTCAGMLEAGDALLRVDPTRTTGGLQLRHALPDLATTQAYLSGEHPGAPAWRAVHDIAADTWRLERIPSNDSAPAP